MLMSMFDVVVMEGAAAAAVAVERPPPSDDDDPPDTGAARKSMLGFPLLPSYSRNANGSRSDRRVSFALVLLSTFDAVDVLVFHCPLVDLSKALAKSTSSSSSL